MGWLRGVVSRYAAARQILLIVTICTSQQTDLLMHGCRYVNRHELIISTIGDMLGNEYMILVRLTTGRQWSHWFSPVCNFLVHMRIVECCSGMHVHT